AVLPLLIGFAILGLLIACLCGLAAGFLVGSLNGQINNGLRWGAFGGIVGGSLGEIFFWGSGLPAWTETLGSIEGLWLIPLILGSALVGLVCAYMGVERAYDATAFFGDREGDQSDGCAAPKRREHAASATGRAWVVSRKRHERSALAVSRS